MTDITELSTGELRGLVRNLPRDYKGNIISFEEALEDPREAVREKVLERFSNLKRDNSKVHLPEDMLRDMAEVMGESYAPEEPRDSNRIVILEVPVTYEAWRVASELCGLKVEEIAQKALELAFVWNDGTPPRRLSITIWQPTWKQSSARILSTQAGIFDLLELDLNSQYPGASLMDKLLSGWIIYYSEKFVDGLGTTAEQLAKLGIVYA